jgi:hypothetical protein
VGRLSCQVKPLREATSPRTVLGIINLNAKNVWEPKRTPKRYEKDSRTNGNTMEAPTNLYEPAISSLGPTSHVNLLLDVKELVQIYPTAFQSIKGPYHSGRGMRSFSPSLHKLLELSVHPIVTTVHLEY